MTLNDFLNIKVEFGVSEPADFVLENGPGPYSGKIIAADSNCLRIILEKKLIYRGAELTEVKACPRYSGDSFVNWDGSVLVANFIVALPTLTHLIGGVRALKSLPNKI